MWTHHVRSENLRQETAATETRQAFPAFLRDAPACSEGRTYSDEGEEMRMVPRRIHGSPLPDVGRPSGFLSSKHQPNYVDPAPVAELVAEAEEYVRASDPLMAGMGDGKGEPWVPEKFVERPKLDQVLSERGERYGRFETNANISQDIKNVLHATPKWMELEADQAEAMEMFASKISRILTGDPDYPDNWDDIAGFATLVAERLRSEK